MDQAVLADIEEPAPRAAMPRVRQSPPYVLLKMIEMREREQSCPQTLEPLVNTPMFRGKGLKLAAVIVQNADGT